MDQLKKFLAVMRIYHYWIITGLVFVLATTGYVIARIYLSDEITKRITVVENKYKEMEKGQSQRADPSQRELRRGNDEAHQNPYSGCEGSLVGTILASRKIVQVARECLPFF